MELSQFKSVSFRFKNKKGILPNGCRMEKEELMRELAKFKKRIKIEKLIHGFLFLVKNKLISKLHNDLNMISFYRIRKETKPNEAKIFISLITSFYNVLTFLQRNRKSVVKRYYGWKNNISFGCSGNCQKLKQVLNNCLSFAWTELIMEPLPVTVTGSNLRF